MSIVTLLVNDTARSGVELGLLKPRQSSDGEYLHPCMWNDGYQRLSLAALPEAAEAAVVEAADVYGDAVADSVPSRLESIVGPAEALIAAIGAAQRGIDASPAEDFTPLVTEQFNHFRAAAVYNIAMARFHAALREDPLTTRSQAVQRLGEVVALLEALEKSPIAEGASAVAPELAADSLRVRALLAAATAIELRVAFLAKDAGTNVEGLAASAHKAMLLYRHVAAVAEKNTFIPEAAACANLAHIKRLFYEGLALFVMSLQPGTTKGESRRRRAQATFNVALEWVLQRMSGARKQVEEEMQFHAHQCAAFDRLQRKGLVTLGGLSTRGRHPDGDATVGADLRIDLLDADRHILDATLLAPGAASKGAPTEEGSAAGDQEVVEAAEEAPQPAPLTLTSMVEHRNLVLGPNGIGKAASSAPYQYLDALVTLRAAKEAALPPSGSANATLPRAPVAVAVALDLFSVELPDGAALRELIIFALMSSNFAAGDRIGIARFAPPSPGAEPQPALKWLEVGEGGLSLSALQDAVAEVKACGRFKESRGTSVLSLVAHAAEELAALSPAVQKHVIAFSDGSDATAASAEADVKAYASLRSTEDGAVTETSWRFPGVPLHAHIVGSVGNGIMLEDCCRRSHGNAGTLLKDSALTDGDDSVLAGRVAALRSWMVSLLNSAATPCARDVVATITSADSDTFIHHAGLAPLVPRFAPTMGDEPLRVREAVVRVPDFSLEHVSHLGVTVALQSDRCVADALELATVTVEYTSPTGERVTLRGSLANISCPELADRDLHPWIQQLRLSCVRGRVEVAHPSSPAPVLARGAETIYVQDCISTVAANKQGDGSRCTSSATAVTSVTGVTAMTTGSAAAAAEVQKLDERPAATLTTPEGAVVELQPDSRIAVSHVGTNSATFELEQGSLAVSTATFGTIRVHVGGGLYAVVVQPNSLVRVGIDVNTETITMRAVRGGASLELRGGAARGLDETNGVMPLDAPKQTTALVGEPPAAPWALAEDGLHGLTPLSKVLRQRLLDEAALDVERIRAVATYNMQVLARYIERRNRTGTMAHTKAARRCRKFLVMHEASLAKQALSNSFAYAVGHDGIDEIKALMDVAASISSPLVEHRRTWAAFVRIRDGTQSLRWRRSVGVCGSFVTQRQRKQVHAMLSARDRAAAEREAEAAAKQKEAADAERRRRQAVISELFSVWDLSRRGAVSVADVQSVLFNLDSRRKPQIRRAIDRWEALREVIDNRAARRGNADPTAPTDAVARSFNVSQLVAIVVFLVEHLEAADFNAFAESLQTAVNTTASAIESTRISRTLFNLFQRLDTRRQGFLAWETKCIALLRYTFGDGTEAFQRVEAVTNAAIAAFKKITPRDSSRPTSRSEHFHANDTAALAMDDTDAVTVDNIAREPITPWVFVTAMKAFFADVSEARANRELAMLCEHAMHGAKFPQNITHVMSRERKDVERRHILEWDLPHCFDGVCDKDVRAVIDPKWKAPDNIQAIAAPLCLLAGLAPLPSVTEPIDVVKPQDYWYKLRSVLKRDARMFFSSLKDFPPLSITHWQAQVVGAALEEKGFESSQLLRVSTVLASLCGWARMMLRVAFLEHDWDARPPVADEIIGAIQAQRAHVEAVRQVDRLAAPGDSGSPAKVTAVVAASPGYSRQFRTVYTPAAVNEDEVATQSRFPPAVSSPRRPQSAISSSPAALRRPQSASLYGSPVPQPPTPTKPVIAADGTGGAMVRTPSRPMTAKAPSVARPASARLRGKAAASAWAENGWEEPAGLDPDRY